MKAISDKGLSNSHVEKKLGFSNGYLATMYKRKSDMSEKNLLKLSNFLNISLSELISGYAENPASTEPFTKEIIELQREVIRLQKEVAKMKEKKIDPDTGYGLIAADAGS